MTARRAVHVLFTGGTISMRVDPGTGAAVPAMSGEEIVARVHGLRKEARLTLEDYARLPGPHVTPDWMWGLRGHVAERLADPSVDGVVLTHGTDTLEETAFLLDLTLESDKPVVFCGAMRTVSDPGWDGPANLMTAVRTAVHPGASGRGVLVAVGEEILAAADATKWHTQALSAFRSPRGPLAVLDRGQVVFQRAPFRVPPLRPTRLVPEVDLHIMATGVDDALLQASLARGARGIVIEATGAGNVPPRSASRYPRRRPCRDSRGHRLALRGGPRGRGLRLRRRREDAARSGRDLRPGPVGTQGAHQADGGPGHDLGRRRDPPHLRVSPREG